MISSSISELANMAKEFASVNTVIEHHNRPPSTMYSIFYNTGDTAISGACQGRTIVPSGHEDLRDPWAHVFIKSEPNTELPFALVNLVEFPNVVLATLSSAPMQFGPGTRPIDQMIYSIDEESNLCVYQYQLLAQTSIDAWPIEHQQSIKGYFLYLDSPVQNCSFTAPPQCSSVLHLDENVNSCESP
jgi:hypothetical protein